MSHKINDVLAEQVNETRADQGLKPLSLSQALELVYNGEYEHELSEDILTNYIL